MTKRQKAPEKETLVERLDTLEPFARDISSKQMPLSTVEDAVRMADALERKYQKPTFSFGGTKMQPNIFAPDHNPEFNDKFEDEIFYELDSTHFGAWLHKVNNYVRYNLDELSSDQLFRMRDMVKWAYKEVKRTRATELKGQDVQREYRSVLQRLRHHDDKKFLEEYDRLEQKPLVHQRRDDDVLFDLGAGESGVTEDMPDYAASEWKNVVSVASSKYLQQERERADAAERVRDKVRDNRSSRERLRDHLQAESRKDFKPIPQERALVPYQQPALVVYKAPVQNQPPRQREVPVLELALPPSPAPAMRGGASEHALSQFPESSGQDASVSFLLETLGTPRRPALQGRQSETSLPRGVEGASSHTHHPNVTDLQGGASEHHLPEVDVIPARSSTEPYVVATPQTVLPAASPTLIEFTGESDLERSFFDPTHGEQEKEAPKRRKDGWFKRTLAVLAATAAIGIAYFGMSSTNHAEDPTKLASARKPVSAYVMSSPAQNTEPLETIVAGDASSSEAVASERKAYSAEESVRRERAGIDTTIADPREDYRATTIQYVVQQGDSLWTVAEKTYGAHLPSEKCARGHQIMLRAMAIAKMGRATTRGVERSLSKGDALQGLFTGDILTLPAASELGQYIATHNKELQRMYRQHVENGKPNRGNIGRFLRKLTSPFKSPVDPAVYAHAFEGAQARENQPSHYPRFSQPQPSGLMQLQGEFPRYLFTPVPRTISD